MTNEVLPRDRSSMLFWMEASVLVSTELVASSSISMGASLTMARAITSCCLCPADISAASPSTVSYPFGSAAMCLSIPTALHASSILSSDTFSLPYTMFSRMVPSNSQASCRTMQNCSWTFARVMSFTDTPSISMSPFPIS